MGQGEGVGSCLYVIRRSNASSKGVDLVLLRTLVCVWGLHGGQVGVVWSAWVCWLLYCAVEQRCWPAQVLHAVRNVVEVSVEKVDCCYVTSQ
jgi:hypothetical protein